MFVPLKHERDQFIEPPRIERGGREEEVGWKDRRPQTSARCCSLSKSFLHTHSSSTPSDTDCNLSDQTTRMSSAGSDQPRSSTDQQRNGDPDRRRDHSGGRGDAMGDDDDDDDDDAFDLNDPENRIVAGGDDEPAGSPPDDENDDDDDDDDGDNGHDGGDAAAAPSGVGTPPVTKVPLRDDASVAAVRPKPLHAMDVHPADPAIVAVAGEEDDVFIYKLSLARASSSASRGAAAAGHSTAELIHVLKGHTDTVTHVRFAPTSGGVAASSPTPPPSSSPTLATGAMDGHVRLWCTSTWSCLFDLSDLSGEVEYLLWHKSGLAIVAGASDAQSVMWSSAKGTVAQYFLGHSATVTCGAWCLPDQKKFVSGSSDGSVIVFNPKTAEVELSIMKDLSNDNAGVSALCPVTPDTIVVGCEDGTLHLISLARGKVVKHLPELHEQCIEMIAPHPVRPQELIATCSCDCRIVVWNAATFEARATFQHSEGITRIVWCAASDAIVASGTDGDLTIWDGLGASGNQPVDTLMGNSRFVTDLVAFEVDPDVAKREARSAGVAGIARGALLYSVSDDGSLRCFDRRGPAALENDG